VIDRTAESSSETNLIELLRVSGDQSANASSLPSGEHGNRLPQHFTADIASGVTLWNSEPRRLDLEFDVTNVSNNIYRIAKESEEIPIQYAPSRTAGGSLQFHF